MPELVTIFFLFVALAVGTGIFRFRSLNKYDKIIAGLVGLSAVTEVLALIMMKLWRNNLALYHIFSPIELLMLCIYFDRTVASIKSTGIARITAVLAIPIAILNTLYLQDPFTVPNSYFVLLEGTFIIIFALLAFFEILMEEERLPYQSAQFWICSSLVVFWSLTYVGWGIYTVLNAKGYPLGPLFQEILLVASCLQCLGFAFTFIRYKKLTPSGA
jgi:hypothetical protein